MARGICAECRKSVTILDRPGMRPQLHMHVCKDGKASRGIEVEWLKKLEEHYTVAAVPS